MENEKNVARLMVEELVGLRWDLLTEEARDLYRSQVAWLREHDCIDTMRVSQIRVTLAAPVELTERDQRQLVGIIDRAARRAAAPGKVHWVTHVGCGLNWSKRDAAVLGREAAADAPDGGEPTMDEDVFCVETFARDKIGG